MRDDANPEIEPEPTLPDSPPPPDPESERFTRNLLLIGGVLLLGVLNGVYEWVWKWWKQEDEEHEARGRDW